MHRITLLIIISCIAAMRAGAQSPDSLPSLKRMYGVGDDEFLVSAYLATASPHGVADLWSFARSLGVSTIQPGLTPEQIDTLLDSPLRERMANGVPGRLIVRGLTPLQDAGVGRELQFYLFDSVQSPFYQWKFTRLAGGTSDFNVREGGAREGRYSAADGTAPGDLIAAGVAYDWHPWQSNRYPTRGYDTTAQDASALVDWYLYRQGANRRAPTFYVVARGHLFPGGGAKGSDSLLRIELWYEIPRGRRYRDANDRVLTASENLEFLYRTIIIPKDSLLPRAGSDWMTYRDISIPVDLYREGSGIYGPLHPDNESHRFDIRVYWLGGERVALRSVAVRDSIGELLLGERRESIDYRNAILRAARRVLYGPREDDTLRRSVIRLMSGIEPHPTEFAASSAVESLLRKGLTKGFAGSDAVAIHNEGGTSEFGLRSFSYLTRPDAIFTEIGLSAPVDTSERYGGDLYKAYRQRMRLPLVQVPSLAEHNGGRFQIPLLPPTADAIERLYTPVMQILRFGQYYPGGVVWPWGIGGVTNLGHGALASRESGARMIPTVFTTGELHFRLSDPSERLDTLMSHPPEGAELRAMVNLGLAYGAHGVHYYWLGNYVDFAYRAPADRSRWIGSNDSWGSNGPLTGDTTLDRADTFMITDNAPTPEHPRGTPRIFIPNFYVGYGVRTREVRRINEWLAQVGPELARLRWRDSYSMHAAATGHPQIDPAQVRPRPLPPNEIVRSIATAARSGALDPPHGTYVELGLFEARAGYVAGRREALRDTHYIFVVNRRTFERPEDIAPGSGEGRLLDSLAESRTVTIGFNLARPGEWRYNVIHVRELAADTTRLPLANGPRMALDTFIMSNDAVSLPLRPGGGALLEITYPLADLFSEPASPFGFGGDGAPRRRE